MKIILVGYRACGKTSVAEYLGELFSVNFLDMDHEIVKKNGIECSRSDKIVHNKNVMCVGVCQSLRSARLVIAEMTNQNPNVLYELGLCHGFEKEVVLLASSMDHIPFDLRSQQVVIYDNVITLRDRLSKIIDRLA